MMQILVNKEIADEVLIRCFWSTVTGLSQIVQFRALKSNYFEAVRGKSGASGSFDFKPRFNSQINLKLSNRPEKIAIN